MRLKETLLILLCVICDQIIHSKPVTVPTNYNEDIDRFNRYSIKNYANDDATRDKPNSFYNRLPNGYQAHVDSAQNDGVDDDDVDYDEHLTDKPSATNAQYIQQQQLDTTNSNYLYNENRIKKKKKKRRTKRPCIPIQSFGSPLFSNRLKREHKNDFEDDRERESGKTLGLLGLLGGGNYGNYGGYPGFYQPPYGGYYRPSFDNFNQRPQYDAPLYNPSGGYPCVPTSFGQGGGYYGGGGGGGNFGSFGGLFDFGSNQQNDYQGPANYPQNVINFNRPPLFGNYPNNQNQNQNYNNNNNNYNTPQGVQNNPLNNNYNNNQFNRPNLTSSGKPLWEGIVDRVQEFVRR